MTSSDAANLFGSGESASNAISITDGPNSIDADVDVEDIDDDKMLEVNSAIAVEKEIAADTIGTVFAATKQHFLPYVEECTLVLVTLLPHYYEGIRKSATDSLMQMIRTFYELSDPQPWQPGYALVRVFVSSIAYGTGLLKKAMCSQAVPLHQNVKDLIGHILPPLLEMYESEDDKYVFYQLC